jgi:hypothetical protein
MNFLKNISDVDLGTTMWVVKNSRNLEKNVYIIHPNLSSFTTISFRDPRQRGYFKKNNWKQKEL